MSYDSLTNRGDYLSPHYLAEVLPRELAKKDGLHARWAEQGAAAPARELQALLMPVRPFPGCTDSAGRAFSDLLGHHIV